MRRILLAIVVLIATNISALAQSTINPGTPQNSFTLATLTVGNGTTFSVPQGRGMIFTWQITFAVAPTSITVLLQGSLDNSSFFTLDSSAVIAGDIKYFGPAAPRFVRCRIDAVVAGAGDDLTCSINILGFNNATAFSGGILSSSLVLQTGCTALSLYFAGDSNNGICSAGADKIDFYNAGLGYFAIHTGILKLRTNAWLGWTGGETSAAIDTRFYRTGGNTITFDNGASGAAIFSVNGSVVATSLTVAATAWFRSLAEGKLDITNTANTRKLSEQFTGIPTCTTNCGTTPTVTGIDSSFKVVMGTTPASGFLITFNGTWPAIPQCMGVMALAGMVIGKLPLTLVTTTTTLTVVTNGTAPSTADVYHFRCSAGQ